MSMDGASCAMALATVPSRPPGRPLPGDATTIRAKVRALVEALLADAGTPAMVRSAAACVQPAVGW